MKKSVSFLLMFMFFVSCLQAQPAEKLTNSIVVKMVKAKLSDDLIIGEINSSEVNFDLSMDSLNYLSSQNVSLRILQAMKIAYASQISTAPPESIPQTNPEEPEEPAVIVPETSVQPVSIPVNEAISKPVVEQIPPPKEEVVVPPVVMPLNENEITVNAMSFIIPMTDLLLFFDSETTSLSGVIQKWDQQIRNSIESGRQIQKNIREVELKLTDKKNANSKGFTNEIFVLKKQLSDYRESYKQFKSKFLADGMNITKELKDIGSETDRAISSKFNAVGNSVRSANSDPSAELAKPLTITKQKIDADVINYVSPVTEMIMFYQNEIIALKEIIQHWNQDVLAIRKKDSELSKQLEPKKQELINYQSDPKKNKKEITALKKQCSDLEKERKLLTQQMGKNSKELSKYLDVICKEAQGAAKERYADIIDNINYVFQDSITGL
ncbi:MAG: hypothetical protein Q8T04_01690 [Bacteroidota bacterium]|nr:hypothetical protein [Bacteroidota bacterium]